VRAGAGLLVSSYKITHGADARDPAGDNSAGMALLKQAVMLGETFSGAAKTHETVAYASHLGAAEANSSRLDDKAPPLKAMLKAASGMLSQESVDAAKAEAPSKPVAPGDDKLPHTSGAIITIVAKAGLGRAGRAESATGQWRDHHVDERTGHAIRHWRPDASA
jgi:hypothetical protein